MSAVKPEIIAIGPADAERLQQISRQTFIETFASVNTKDNIRHYVEENLSLATLTAELNNSDSQFYLASSEGKAIGYLKVNVNAAQTEIKNADCLEIERVYVVRTFIGKQVGQILFEKAMEIARNLKVNYVWLAVWEENPRAIRFYEKNGFKIFDKHIFKLGNDMQTDIMMKLELN